MSMFMCVCMWLQTHMHTWCVLHGVCVGQRLTSGDFLNPSLTLHRQKSIDHTSFLHENCTKIKIRKPGVLFIHSAWHFLPTLGKIWRLLPIHPGISAKHTTASSSQAPWVIDSHDHDGHNSCNDSDVSWTGCPGGREGNYLTFPAPQTQKFFPESGTPSPV